MKGKKFYLILPMAVFIMMAVLLTLRHQVQGDSNTIGVIKSAKLQEKKVEATNYDVSRNELLSMLMGDKFSDTRFSQQMKAEQDRVNAENMQENTDEKDINNIDNLIKNQDLETIYRLIKKEDESDRDYIPESSYVLAKDTVKNQTMNLPVAYLSQFPELPTGCEITSLTTVLNYLGYNVSKETMADDYLEKGDLTNGSFWDYFLGDPRADDAFGCYATPIVTAANKYLNEFGSDYKAYNVSYSNFEYLLNEVGSGNPVILWSTIDLEKAFITFTWTINDSMIQWIAPEHCVVMIGYDLNANTVTLSDPLKGIVTVDLDQVNLRYRQMCCQAVVIRSNSEKVTNPANVEGNSATQTTSEQTTSNQDLTTQTTQAPQITQTTQTPLTTQVPLPTTDNSTSYGAVSSAGTSVHQALSAPGTMK